MSVGPKRNVIKELKDAFQNKDPQFHFGIYYSLFEWFNPLYLKDKIGNFQTRQVDISYLIKPNFFYSIANCKKLINNSFNSYLSTIRKFLFHFLTPKQFPVATTDW